MSETLFKAGDKVYYLKWRVTSKYWPGKVVGVPKKRWWHLQQRYVFSDGFPWEYEEVKEKYLIKRETETKIERLQKKLGKDPSTGPRVSVGTGALAGRRWHD